MYVYIDVVKGEDYAIIYLFDDEVAYIKCEDSGDVTIEDYAHNDKFVMKNGDFETCVSIATNAYKDYYKAFGLDVEVAQTKPM